MKRYSAVIKQAITKTTVLLLFIVTSSVCTGQQQQADSSFTAFKTYIFGIMEDSARHWPEYPAPPQVTESVLRGMQKEIMADDSAKYFLERLSFKKYSWAIDYQQAFGYIDKMDYEYSLIALAAHWNPDARVSALLHLNKKLSIRPLAKRGRMQKLKWKKYDQTATRFLLYLLENNPLMISGSENATIHGYYISNITWNLDLLTKESISGKKLISEWYKNDVQFKTAVSQWKSHLK